MKKTDRTKQELALSLAETAEEILSFGEYPDLPQKAGLKEKLDSHSAKWNRAYREFVAEAFLFAKQIYYPASLFRQNSLSVGESGELVALYSETLMKVACRIFAKKSFAGGAEIVAYFEGAVKNEFERETWRERGEEKRQGTGLSEHKQRILSDYNRFKNNLEMVAKNRNELTEAKIRSLYLNTANRYGITEEKLREIIAAGENTAVILESDSVVTDGEGGEELAFSFLEGGSPSSEDFLSGEEQKIFIECIEKNWEGKPEKTPNQGRTKKYLSSIVTHQLLSKLKKSGAQGEKLFSLLRTKSFVDKSLLSDFEATGELCDRKTLLSNFPLLDKDGNVVMDDARGKPKCKDEGRANNDLKKFFKEVSTLYEADAL